MVGGQAIQANLSSAAIGGRIVCVGRLSGSVGELNLDDLARKRVSLIGTTFRTRTPKEHASVVRHMLAHLWQPISEGSICSIVDRVFPLDRADEAQEHVRSGTHFGKVLLKVSE